MSKYDKIVFVILATLSLMIIGGCPYKNVILGFILVMAHHSYVTVKLVKNINKSGFLDFDNFRFLAMMMISTALIKLSIGYTNGAYIINDMMGFDIKPFSARMLVLIIVVFFIIVPFYFYDRKRS